MSQSFAPQRVDLESKIVLASQVKKLDVQTMEIEEMKKRLADLQKHIEVQQ
jgi:hypothetical protein